MRKIILLSIVLVSFFAASAQYSPFKSLPHPKQYDKVSLGTLLPTGSIWEWRFIANVAGFQYPGSQVVTGAGFGYQNLSLTDSNKYYCNFSISAMVWAGGSLQPSLTPPSNIISYGIEAGILNNLVMAGAAINNGKIVAIISIGISLNN